MKIYLDNCCFNRPYDDQSHVKIRIESEAKLFVQAKILDNQIQLVWSYILDYENHFNPFDERRESIGKWKEHAVEDVEETAWIIEKAKSLTAIGIKSKDALHVACAIASQCDYLLTTDKKLIAKTKNSEDIEVINPMSFILLLEGEI